MKTRTEPLHFKMQGRNGYWAIDEYNGSRCMDIVDAFNTKRVAVSVCNKLNSLASEINELNGLETP